MNLPIRKTGHGDMFFLGRCTRCMHIIFFIPLNSYPCILNNSQARLSTCLTNPVEKEIICCLKWKVWLWLKLSTRLLKTSSGGSAQLKVPRKQKSLVVMIMQSHELWKKLGSVEAMEALKATQNNLQEGEVLQGQIYSTSDRTINALIGLRFWWSYDGSYTKGYWKSLPGTFSTFPHMTQRRWLLRLQMSQMQINLHLHKSTKRKQSNKGQGSLMSP